MILIMIHLFLIKFEKNHKVFSRIVHVKIILNIVIVDLDTSSDNFKSIISLTIKIEITDDLWN